MRTGLGSDLVNIKVSSAVEIQRTDSASACPVTVCDGIRGKVCGSSTAGVGSTVLINYLYRNSTGLGGNEIVAGGRAVAFFTPVGCGDRKLVCNRQDFQVVSNKLMVVG